METKSINVLYQGKEKIININPEEYKTFESFTDKIKNEFNQTQIYQLMAMNYSERYLVLTSDNYMKVLNEKIPEGLKLFMSEMVKVYDNTPEEENIIKEAKDDDDFIVENDTKDNNDNNNDIKDNNDNIDNNNDTKDKNDNIDNNNDNNNNLNIVQEKIENEKENNEGEAQLDQNKININNEKEDESANSGHKSVELKEESSLNDKNFEKNLDLEFNNIIPENEEDGNYYIKNKFILTSKNINKQMFNKEKCSICKDKIEGIKYICCLCDQCTLCEECELYHNHPCFKYKNNFISSLSETCDFLSKDNDFKLPYESTSYSKFLRKEYDLKLEPYSDLEFSLRPNKVINIPIKILNYSKERLDSNNFIIICKNQKYIYLSQEKKDFIIDGDEYILNIKCITPERSCGKENIFIEIYSQELPIKKSRRLMHEYIIDVNFDSEDDKLNMELKNDDSIFCFNKEHKRIALQLYKSSGKEYKIKNIINCLFENNWDSHKALKALKKKK